MLDCSHTVSLVTEGAQYAGVSAANENSLKDRESPGSTHRVPVNHFTHNPSHNIHKIVLGIQSILAAA